MVVRLPPRPGVDAASRRVLGRTHAATGTAAWLLLAPVVQPWGEWSWTQLGIGTAVATWAALLPDLDEPGARASRALLGPFRRPVSMTIRRLAGGHRAGTHYPLIQLAGAGAVWAALSAFAPGWAWLALPLLVGLVVHSLGDACTTQGVRLLWPMGLTVRLPLTTGGHVETFLIAPLVTMMSLWLCLRSIGVVS